MGQKIKYIIKGQPTRIKKISSYLIGISIVLLVIFDFLYSPLETMPLELQVFTIGELIPRTFLELNSIVILLLVLGMTLYVFRWRKGTIDLTENLITIQGQIALSIMVERVKEISFFDSDFFVGNNRLIQIVNGEGVFKILFPTDDSFIDFSERLVLSAGQYDQIKINSSVIQRTES